MLPLLSLLITTFYLILVLFFFWSGLVFPNFPLITNNLRGLLSPPGRPHTPAGCEKPLSQEQSRRVFTDSFPVSPASKGAEGSRYRHRALLRTRNPPPSRPLTKVALAAGRKWTLSAAAAAGSASPRSWDEAEAQEEEEAVGDGDGDADADGEDDPGHWDADASDAAAFGASGGGRPHARSLAAEEIRQMLEGKPLADKMRPDTLQDYIGQSRAVGQETLLRSLLETNEIPSLILWGPPGCGKTTLAHIIANNSKKHSIRFVTLSATNAKTNDVRDVIKQAQNEKSFFKRKTILFIDEIHRFNKSQQDTFLPHVECGTITLIGATTENPSFQVNAALLSRCRVIVLEKLPVEAMVTILMRAINSLGIHVLDSSRPTDPLSHSSNSSSEPSVFIEDKAVDTLAYLSDGDARAGLNGLQLAVLARLSSRKMFCKKSGQTYSPSRVLITENDVKEGLQQSHILYDRAGEEHYNCISALHKSMRGSDQSASLYWLARMLEGGEDPLYVARRLVRFASEDIGASGPVCSLFCQSPKVH
ncbi:atpase wrnip1-like isoform 1 [Lynx pardinus]|uniref:Atpase wrnip1-like isoform 1 n=1 Tax=Lynx pardinus TaxID=191816 RepID=A0A485PR54_LYNPA|nr:atpase wrnip1-like isoform 1 [Lynx pardinus]